MAQIQTIYAPQTEKQLKQVFTELEKHQKKLIEISNMSIDFYGGKSASNPNEIKNSIATIDKLNKKIKEQDVLLKKLQSTQKGISKTAKQMESASLKQSRSRIALNKQKEKSIALNTKLASSWNQLNVKLQKAELNYRNVASSLGKGNKQTRVAQKEVLKLRKQVDSINKPIKRWNNNVGNYASGLRGLAGALGWAGLAFAIINGVKATYEAVKVYDTLNKALEKVTSSQSQANAEFGFVVDLSERLGLNLRNTTDDYIKFLASVKGTNLEGSKARKIFEGVSKAAASMGLSADDTSGTLRALNQIISKGKVQAEELRGQLGDRIPGAFQIMARALKVTTAELDEMLKKGELIADEVLPKFAEEMEKTFGVENTNRIETLTGSTNRLANAWDLLVLSVDSGNGIISKSIKFLVDRVTLSLMTLKALISGTADENQKIVNKSYTQTKDLLDVQKQSNDVLEGSLSLNNKRLAQLKTAEKFSELSEKQLAQNEKEQLQQIGIIKAIKDKIAQNEEEKNSLIDKLIIADKNLRQIDLEKMSIKELTDLLATYNKAINKNISDKRKQIEVSEQLLKANSSETVEIWKLKAGLEAKVKELEKVVKLYPIGSDGAEKYTEKIRLLKIALGEISDIDTTEVLGEIEEFFKNNDFTNPPPETESKWKDTFTNIVNVATQAFGIITALSDASFARQFANLEKRRDFAIDFAGDSAIAQANIDEQYDRKKTALERKQAEAQKKQAIFEIAINTASAVVQALPNIPLSIAMGALGAIQLGLVASQQIPAFHEGGIVGGTQDILVNDDPYGKKGSNYKEVIKEPSGKLHFPKGKNVKMNVPKGSTVFPTYDAFMQSLDMNLLNNNIMPIGQGSIIPMVVNNGITKGEIAEVMSNHSQNLIGAMNNQNGLSVHIDENGLHKYATKQGVKTKVMNARWSGRGNRV